MGDVGIYLIGMGSIAFSVTDSSRRGFVSVFTLNSTIDFVCLTLVVAWWNILWP